ncbi:MAG: hypothetical protein AAB423_02845 [Patescibacteria group bacterium]
MIIILAFFALLFPVLATPSLSRKQGDTTHKNAVSATVSAIAVYQSNNRGKLPAKEQIEDKSFLPSDEFEQEIKQKYKFLVTEKDEKGVIAVHLAKKCNGEEGSSRTFSVSTKLEDNNRHCVDS